MKIHLAFIITDVERTTSNSNYLSQCLVLTWSSNRMRIWPVKCCAIHPKKVLFLNNWRMESYQVSAVLFLPENWPQNTVHICQMFTNSCHILIFYIKCYGFSTRTDVFCIYRHHNLLPRVGA